MTYLISADKFTSTSRRCRFVIAWYSALKNTLTWLILTVETLAITSKEVYNSMRDSAFMVLADAIFHQYLVNSLKTVQEKHIDTAES